MAQFIVSARKYRPNSFGSLIGQENIATTLKNAILREQLAHAYLFCGPRGVGKTSAARIFAKIINCANPSADMEPCGECESCRAFAEGRSYNIHELDAASNNSVDDIRALTDKVRIPPQIGRYSVYIIDEVHMLSASAFNAFLKTLEEPPAYAIFILATTEKHKILPTILSRCQTYDFNRITISGIVQNLRHIAQCEGITISEDAMHIIAQKADGAMRDALTLFDQMVAFCGNDITYEQVVKNLNVLDYDYYFRLTDAFLAGDSASALRIFDEILAAGFNSQHFIGGLCSHFRDLIVCARGAADTLLELAPTVAERYQGCAATRQPEFLFQALDIATTCDAAYKQSGNPRLLIEFALMKICRLCEPVAAPIRREAPQPSAAPAPAPVPTPAAAAAPAPATPAPKAEPAPAPAPEPAPKPVEPSQPAEAPRKPTGLSIKNMLQQAAAVSAPANKAEVKPLEPETVNAAWQKMAAAQPQPRLSAVLAAGNPVIDAESHELAFAVASQAQKDWIDHTCRQKLEAYLRTELTDNTIRLRFTVDEQAAVVEEKVPYMQSDKDRYLRQNSPEFVELRKEFELEVK
ncbi:MAG: DNA polymerase III subunit gamma/tau [Bacteroidales bacterium]|nr:DNA polymerase III subunit gamma/tau [Bacteroidales bacterium]